MVERQTSGNPANARTNDTDSKHDSNGRAQGREGILRLCDLCDLLFKSPAPAPGRRYRQEPGFEQKGTKDAKEFFSLAIFATFCSNSPASARSGGIPPCGTPGLRGGLPGTSPAAHLRPWK